MRVRSILVTAQVTLALMLSIGAGLLLRSLSHLQGVDTGFDPAHLATVSISLPEVRYKDQGAITGFYRSLLQRLSAMPGAQSAAYGYPIPFGEGFEGRAFQVVGRTPQPGEPAMQANTRLVTPEFFSTLGIPLMRGRWFTAEDVEKSKRVVVIDDALAARYWPGEDPLGQRIRQSDVESTIVGVVGHTKVSDLASVDEKGVFYQSFYQGPIAFGSLIVRTSGDPERFTSAIREAVNSLDPRQPVYDAASMQGLIDASLAGRRFTVVLLAAFAGAALLLAALGLYSVINYGVTQRTQEIGIRLALGASRSRIMSLILGRGMWIALPGLALGWIAAYQAASLAPGQLFGVAAFDPATFAATALLLMAIAMLACYLPARRATRLDPVESCRCE